MQEIGLGGGVRIDNGLGRSGGTKGDHEEHLQQMEGVHEVSVISHGPFM